jgi:hypothetical protein
MKTSTRLATLLLAATVLASPLASSQTAPDKPPPATDGDYQPKFIWGVLLKFAVNYAVSAFGSYMLEKLTPSLTPASLTKMLFNSKSAQIVPLETSANTYGAKTAGAPENAQPGEPTAPLKIENGRENYQAVHVALMNFDRQGNALGFHPVSDGFRSGDRFKLRVLPTFDGLLVIDNINPRGERKQIYPAQAKSVVSVKAGIEIMVPLGRDEYFEFAGATGDDQLVVTLRDPRAFGEAASKATVSRKDENNGSNFFQELLPGTYPVISQSLKFRHGG